MSKPQLKLAVPETFMFLFATSVLYLVSLSRTLRTLRDHFETAMASKWIGIIGWNDLQSFQYWQFLHRLSCRQGIYLGKLPNFPYLLGRSIPHHIGKRLGFSFPDQRWSHPIAHQSGRRSHAFYASSASLPQQHPNRLPWPTHNSIDYAPRRLCRCRYVLGATSSAYHVQLWSHSRSDPSV